MCLSLRSYTIINSYPVSNINKHNAVIFSCYELFVLYQTVNIIIYVCSHSNETKRNYNNKYIINIIIYVCSHSNETKRNYNNKYIINIIIYDCSHSNETKRDYNNKYIINIIIYVCSHTPTKRKEIITINI